jgi:hypothetical protein
MPCIKGSHHSPEHCAKISAALMGINRSPETREKISIARKGKRASPETCARMSAARMGNKNSLGYKQTPETCAKRGAVLKGKRHSAETLAKMSVAQSGSNNPSWRGGTSRAPYAWTFNVELKEEVRRRDSHKCQLCGTPQKECRKVLSVHHIDYDKRNSDPVNLTALCHSCHMRTNFNREHWKMFFQKKSLAKGK